MHWLKSIVTATLTVIFTFVLTAVVLAQEAPVAGADAAAQAQSISWLEQSMKGGTVGFIIIGLSVVTLGLTIEGFVKIRRDKLLPVDLLQELEVLFEDEDYQEALNAAEADNSPFARIVKAGLNKISNGFDAMMDAVFDETNAVNMKYQQKIGWVQLLANISPMLGLFGTVQGMIITFDMISKSSGSPSPKELANGISVALVTTFLGLIVAIPATTIYYILRLKVNNIMSEMNAITIELFEKFRPVE